MDPTALSITIGKRGSARLSVKARIRIAAAPCRDPNPMWMSMTWARILSREYERMQLDGLCHQQSVMDDYGATNPAEFFAVATETFFEKPEQLKKMTPELYNELKKYYQVDPAEWLA